MNKSAYMVVLSVLLSLSATAQAGKVSESANVEFKNGIIGAAFGSDNNAPRASRDSAANQGNATIPQGHRPPPGKCRIWFHDREPGKQPPPGECKKLRKNVPPNASLIRG